MCGVRIYSILRLETIQPITHLFYWPKWSFSNGGSQSIKIAVQASQTRSWIPRWSSRLLQTRLRPLIHGAPLGDRWLAGWLCDTLKLQAFCRKIPRWSSRPLQTRLRALIHGAPLGDRWLAGWLWDTLKLQAFCSKIHHLKDLQAEILSQNPS